MSDHVVVENQQEQRENGCGGTKERPGEGSDREAAQESERDRDQPRGSRRVSTGTRLEYRNFFPKP
jgi:hypothetical protein